MGLPVKSLKDVARTRGKGRPGVSETQSGIGIRSLRREESQNKKDAHFFKAAVFELLPGDSK